MDILFQVINPVNLQQKGDRWLLTMGYYIINALTQ